MKKILLAGLSLFVLNANAQLKTQPTIQIDPSNMVNNIKKEIGTVRNYNINKNQFNNDLFGNTKKTRAVGKRYFSFPRDMDTFLISLGGLGIFKNDNLDSRLMWKDSSVKVAYTNGFSSTEVMSIYQVLDPFASRWNSEAFVGELAIGSNYSVDTLGMVCSYSRIATKPNVVDTLRMSFIKGAQMASLSYPASSAIGLLYSDTVEIAGVKTTYASKIANSSSTANPTVIIKDIYLNAASEFDTLSSGFNYFESPVNISMTNDIIGATVTFISGDPNIIVGDSIVRYNNFRFATFSEGTGTGAGFVSSNMYREDNDYNMSGNSWCPLPYGLSAGAAERYYYPAISYSDAVPANILGWQYHWLVWTINTTNGTPVGINKLEKQVIINVSPNPANSIVNFDLNFKNAFKATTITLTNMTGQIVKTVQLGNVAANSSKGYVMNISDLSSGLYIYTITADGKSQSGKLSVN
jgi:Secretion system C-terminal sorting domain